MKEKGTTLTLELKKAQIRDAYKKGGNIILQQ